MLPAVVWLRLPAAFAYTSFCSDPSLTNPTAVPSLVVRTKVANPLVPAWSRVAAMVPPRRSSGAVVPTLVPVRLPCFRCGIVFPTGFPRKRLLVCHHWQSSLNGFPPCQFVCCKDCFRSSNIVFETVHDDSVGLRLQPPHCSQGPWHCPMCVVRANTGRDVSHAVPGSHLCLDLEIQRQIDEQHAKAIGTRGNYVSATSQIARFGVAIGVELLPTVSSAPPVRSLAVLMSWYTLNAMLSGGRASAGRTLSTMDGHNSAYADFFAAYGDGPSPTNSPLYRRFYRGLERRVQRNPARAFALSVSMIVEMLAELKRQMPPHVVSEIAYGHVDFSMLYRLYSFGTVLAMSFLSLLRGNEAYQLILQQVLADIVGVQEAARRRCHAHFMGDFAVTKTAMSHRVRLPVVLFSKHGIRLGDFLLPFLALRARLPAVVLARFPASRSRLFLRSDGRPFDSHYFLHQFLRPAMVILQQSPRFSAELSRVVVGTQVTTNSLRRGGNTALAIAGVSRELRFAMGRWKDPDGSNQIMIDLYEQIGLQRFLSASFDMADEVLLAPVARDDPGPVADSTPAVLSRRKPLRQLTGELQFVAPVLRAGSTNLRGSHV